MKNKRFVCILASLCLLFLVAFSGGGCGGSGGGGSSSNYEEMPDNPDVPYIPDNPSNPDNPNNPENPSNPDPNPGQDTDPNTGGQDNNPSNPGNDTNPDTNSVFTVTFNSNGGTSVAPLTVKYGDVVKEPLEPTREEDTFLGWYDKDGYIFEFGLPIGDNIVLNAEWAENYVPKTAEGIKAMEKIYEAIKEIEYGGDVTVSLDKDGKSPIKSLDVSFVLDSSGAFDSREIESGPLMYITGLVGNPVEISIVGKGKVTSAEIAFGVKSSTANGDYGIVYYDPIDGIVAPLNSKVVGNVVKVTTDHFGQYAVVELAKFTEARNMSKGK